MVQAAAVDVSGGEFGMEPVKPQFQITYTTPIGVPFDLCPDGQKLILSDFPESVPTPMVLVANWNSELKKN